MRTKTTTTGTATTCHWNIAVTPDLDPGFWSYAPTLESKLGRKFAGFRFNGAKPTSLRNYDLAYDAGWHWAYANGKPDPINGNYSGYWAATASGAYDAAWNTYFQLVKADTRFTTQAPLHFSYHHEQSITTEGGGLTNGTPADYAAAFRHVRSLMTLNKAHVSDGGNMLACWTPHWLQLNKANPFYVQKTNPGAAYYDLLGCDVYVPTTASTTAAAQFAPLHAYALSLGKPFFTGEHGIAGTDTKVVKYLTDMDTLLKSYGAGTAPGQVTALCWTTRIAAGGDYRIDATPTRLATYKRLATDPFYTTP